MRYWVAAWMLLFSAASYSDSFSGNELYADCTAADSNYFSAGYCLGFLRASLESYGGAGHCDVDGITGNQTKMMFIKFAEDNPGLLHEPAEMLVPVSMHIAIDCPINPE